MILLAFLLGCAESELLVNGSMAEDANIIHVGGIQSTGLETTLGAYTTRADGENTPVDAETVNWLLGPLFGGLDITYGAVDQPETEKVAILRLQKNDPNSADISASNIKYSEFSTSTEKIAEYSFNYRNSDGREGDPAMWYDNGAHYFQGVFVPSQLRYLSASGSPATVNDPTTGSAKSLLTDQSKRGESDNYTLLARYLGMPADATINATVGRIKLPFRHRLARVLTYVLIDPAMGETVTIKGYKKAADGITDVEEEDAATSEIKFCNVDVLAGVKETVNSSQHSDLTPQWKEKERKVIPHFLEERTSVNSLGTVVDVDNFIMYYDTERKIYIFPSDDEDWVEARDAWNEKFEESTGTTDAKIKYADENSGFERTLYGTVPCYDLIVRPTYSSPEMVMYDEALSGSTETEKEASKVALAEKKNNIDFELTLNNGLQYYKSFQFDLDANYQTIVYLRIHRESIDYNASGAEPWKEDENYDNYYGINNQNGNTLSYAGSSWQRAYRLSGHFSQSDNVTDGHWYTKDDATDDDAVQDDDAMPWYPQYVDQTKWIEMFAEAYEGGKHHGDYFILDEDITIDASQIPANFVFTGHLDGQDHTITLANAGADWYEDHYTYDESTNYVASKLYVLEGTEYVEFHLPELYVYVSEELYSAEEAAAENAKNLIADSEGRQPGDEGYIETYPTDYTPVNENDIKIKAHYDAASPTLAEVMSEPTKYFVKSGDETYEHPTLPTIFYEYVNHPISHTGSSTLFAGLNGAYSATKGVANVHEENGILVPYVDNESRTGWRAEIINTKIAGADLFPASVFNADGSYDVTKVSGYIYNCWKGSEKIKSHTPTLPKHN